MADRPDSDDVTEAKVLALANVALWDFASSRSGQDISMGLRNCITVRRCCQPHHQLAEG